MGRPAGKSSFRSPGVPLGALVCLLALAAPAAAQDERPSVLLVLDASKSMNEPAGGGKTRLDAAKEAVGAVLEAVPQDAPLGLRVYGSEVEEAGRAAGCRDTRLVAPVQTGARDEIRDTVEALQGKGRTPIGRSLLAVPGDFPRTADERSVILVSDGGDNCAPPDPCKAAARISKQGVDLRISVVGLQVSERVRRQLKCIADAGGGTYVDAQDPDKLRQELLVAFARGLRTYEVTGTPVEGGADDVQAPRLGEGLFQDEISPDEELWYAVDVKPGERLFAAATVIPRGDAGSGVMRLEVTGPGSYSEFDQSGFGISGFTEVPVETRSAFTEQAGVAGGPQPGRYLITVAVDDLASEGRELPFELAVETLAPGERPSLVRSPGELPPPERKKTPGPGKPAAADEDEGSGAALAAGAGAGLLGLLGGFLLARRRRP